MSDVELTAVKPQHELDREALHRYMLRCVEGYRGKPVIQQFEGGQSNPTFLLENPSARYVLRKQPPGELLRSAHAVDREYRVMAALVDTGVPVPRTYCLCEDESVIGTKFYVMEMVEGRLFKATALPTLEREERRSVYLDLVRVLAALHGVDAVAVGLDDFGRPGNYFSRQVRRWSRQYRDSETETIEAMNRLIDWLPKRLPAEAPPCVVHGDYRLGNVLLHPVEPKIAAILDWELSTLGDGLADLGYWLQEFHMEETTDADTIVGADLGGLGIPTESELIGRYCEARDIGVIENWMFYIVYNMFRSAAIAQGVYKRGLDGNASSARALEYREITWIRAELGWKLAQQI